VLLAGPYCGSVQVGCDLRGLIARTRPDARQPFPQHDRWQRGVACCEKVPSHRVQATRRLRLRYFAWGRGSRKGGLAFHSPTSLYFHRLLSEAYQGCPASVVSCSKAWRLISVTLSLCHFDIKAVAPAHRSHPITSHPTQHKPRPYDSTCSRHHLHEFLLTRPSDPPPLWTLPSIYLPSSPRQLGPRIPHSSRF
jgi:hypothetical protein